MKKGNVLAVFLALTLLLVPFSAFAEEAVDVEIEQERIDLFLASQSMLAEENKLPHMRVGMLLTTLGEDSEISLGVKVEANLDKEGKARFLTEVIYLKEEDTLAGFASIKLVPFGDTFLPLYIGGGVGYADDFRYQAFAGIEITKNFFAEMRYANIPGGLGKNLHLATGFQLTF